MRNLRDSVLIDTLQWRYATKKFDSAQEIPAGTWSTLEQTLVLTPSSLGLQPWHFIVVRDKALRKALTGHSHGQTQICDCSHFLVIAHLRDPGTADTERLVAAMREARHTPEDKLAAYKAMMESMIGAIHKGGKESDWTARQAYIALGQFMLAAAMLGVDTCPMEGMDPLGYDKVLGLEGSRYKTAVACAAGYRAADDPYAQAAKVRYAATTLIEHR